MSFGVTGMIIRDLFTNERFFRKIETIDGMKQKSKKYQARRKNLLMKENESGRKL